ncbi:unnamed protein product, partial [Timema podura]|nr:unnamed protein product [Timema podura]
MLKVVMLCMTGVRNGFGVDEWGKPGQSHGVGGNGMQQVKAIDVIAQNTISILLVDFVDYFLSPYRQHPLNLLSLEMSQTSLKNSIQPPLISRILDWAEIAWPDDSTKPRADVQRYCLLSTKRSFTDFHVDFGGSSVWYHVVKLTIVLNGTVHMGKLQPLLNAI